MKLKVVAIILLFSLVVFFGLKKISTNNNKTPGTNIQQLNIFKYLPEDNKSLFISNFDISNISNNFANEANIKNQADFVLIKDSILDYLGIDLGKNKLEDIYNNELIISISEDKEKLKDNILMIFKIKPEKNLDDILHLSNQIDQTDKIIPIYRKNKLNYLNYIYRTDDNYVIASSNQKLIINCINPSDNLKEKKFKNKIESLGLKEEKNILFTKKFGQNIYFNNEIFIEKTDDIIATTFDLKNRYLILKSYLLNNKKNLDIFAYDKLINKENTNKVNPEVSIFSDLKNFEKYLKPLTNDFEKSFFEEFNQKINQNILVLNSNKDWLITFKKNSENQIDISDIKKMKDFNKYTLKKNKDIYTIYSKDILEEKEDEIKQLTYENIYSVESRGIQIVSNYLIDGKKLDETSKKFFNLINNNDKSTFLFAEVEIKDADSNKIEYFWNLKDLNFLIKNILKISNEEYLEIIRQSIPEKNPILYTKTSLKML